MMLSEFIERTGFEPTADEYAKIEEDYYDFDGDKDAFCKQFVEQGGEKKIYAARAVRIKELESKLVEVTKSRMATEYDLRKKIKNLEAQLDMELAWEPCDAGTHMDQASYEKLLASGKVMTEQEAKAFLADECGFDPEKIHINTTACRYEVNKYRRTRKADEYFRQPVYESTDWNYIRFDCAMFMYEFVDGELEFYCV